MRPVEGALLVLAIVADTLSMSLMLPSFSIYLANCYWVTLGIKPNPSKDETLKDAFLFLITLLLYFTLAAILRIPDFLDYALKEFVPKEGPLHSGVDKVLKGIAWSLLTLSVYKINFGLPLVNPYSGEEFKTFAFWTIVFLSNIYGADFETTRQETPRFERTNRIHGTPNPNDALLTPPNQSWDNLDASLAILFVAADGMSNYLVPSLTIFITNYWLERIYWAPSSENEKSVDFWMFVGFVLTVISLWASILFILRRAFFYLAPPGGIHRSTIVQIASTLNGLWFGITVYKMSLDLPVTQNSLGSDGVMASLGYWCLTSVFLCFKDLKYDPFMQEPPKYRGDIGIVILYYLF